MTSQSTNYKALKTIEELRHKNTMEELQYIRGTAKLKHELELESLRIKNAEIRRNLERQVAARDWYKPNKTGGKDEVEYNEHTTCT